MCLRLESLNIHIWMNICNYLTPDDLFSLGLTSNALREMTKASDLWKNYVREIWFSGGDADQNEFRMIFNYRDFFITHSNFFKITSRYLDSMVNQEDPEEILLTAWAWIIPGPLKMTMVPLLSKLKNDKKIDYRKRWYASLMLRAMRKKHAMDNHTAVKTRAIENKTTEEAFFLFSYLDAEFDDLLPYREKFYKDFHGIIKSNPEYHSYKSFDERLVIAIRSIDQLFKQNYKVGAALQESISQAMPNHDKKFSENYSLLRIYAGETWGNYQIKYAIIQRALSQLGIKSNVLTHFLVVYDENSNEKYLISFIQDPNTVQIYPLNYFDRLSASGITDINEMMKPIDTQFLGMMETYTRKFEPLNKVMHVDKGSLRYKELYPISKLNYDSGIAYYLDIFPKNKFGCVTDSGDVWTILGNVKDLVGEDIIYDTFSIICFGEITSYSKKVNQLTTRDEEIKKEIINQFFNPFKLKYNENTNAPRFKIGQIVKNKRSNYYGIVIQYDGFYLLFPQLRENVIREESLELMENYDEKIFEMLTDDPLIGCFFSRYDEKNNRFIPDKHLLKLYPENFYFND